MAMDAMEKTPNICGFYIIFLSWLIISFLALKLAPNWAKIPSRSYFSESLWTI
jgi:hypothetical protein